MRTHGLFFAAVLLFGSVHFASGSEEAVAKLRKKWDPLSANFSDPRTGDLDQLRVQATENFLRSKKVDKKKALEALGDSWTKALTESPGPHSEPSLVEVRWDHGGSLWRVVRNKDRARLRLVDHWDDDRFVWDRKESARGRWFIFFGGQSVSGGNSGSSSGVNARIGTTLFKDRYDIAFLFNQTSTAQPSPLPKVKSNSYGAVGRVLFRKPNNWGYNLGAQLVSLTAKGAQTNNQVSAVMGINYYVPRGAWDVSLSLGDEGTRTFVLGYSIFLSR